MIKNLLVVFIFFSPFIHIGQKLVTGEILNSENEPLAFCHIYNASQKQGTLSNEDGIFTIQASLKDSLVISALGYANYHLVVTARNSTTFNQISLTTEAVTLDEVIVRPNNLTGNIERDAKNIKTNQYNNFGFPHPKDPYKDFTPSQILLAQSRNGVVENIVYRLNGKYKNLKKNIAFEKEEKWVAFTEKLIDTSYYTIQLKLKETEIVPFLFFMYEEKNRNEYVKNTEVLDLMQFMELKVKSFKGR